MKKGHLNGCPFRPGDPPAPKIVAFALEVFLFWGNYPLCREISNKFRLVKVSTLVCVVKFVNCQVRQVVGACAGDYSARMAGAT